jgi:hypothetical protein
MSVGAAVAQLGSRSGVRATHRQGLQIGLAFRGGLPRLLSAGADDGVNSNVDFTAGS